jgi:membrane dipeptidase
MSGAMSGRHGEAGAWFDAHLDLAYLAVMGRNMDAEPADAGGPDLPAGVTLPSLRRGRVRHCLATIFTEAGGEDPRIGYPVGDAEAANARGVAQLEVYQRWAAEGKAAIGLAGPAVAGPRMGILIEGADPVRTPGELAWWAERGVVAVGLAWWRASRYAGGNGSVRMAGDSGLSRAGRDMVREIDRLGLVHDLSHLSDRACDELLSMSDGRVMASHSNCRSIMGDPGNQRHLTDEVVREIGRRAGQGKGMIGLVIYSRFISPRRDKPEDGRATVEETLAHVDRVCELTGTRGCIGLGSDMDGGFSARRLVEGVDGPEGLEVLVAGLTARGWSAAEVEGFRNGHWRRFFGV